MPGCGLRPCLAASRRGSMRVDREVAAHVMQLELPQRLAIMGITGLAALSVTHWLRAHVHDPAPAISFVLGCMPNLAAAFAMPLILATFTARTSKAPITQASRRAFLGVLVFTTLGLLGWELVQTRSSNFVFDTNDVIATVVGAALALATYRWLARRHAA